MVDIQKRLEEAKKGVEAAEWSGTFQEYLDMVIANPRLARTTHAYIYDMLHWAGVTQSQEGPPRYNLFEGYIFGLDDALARIVQYFRAAALGLESKKRMLLLIGPTGSSKSTIVELIKSGLERYSRVDDGAIYGIDGCPSQEQPMHLIPDEMRHEMARDHGLHIQGDLCPQCRHNLRHEYGGDITRVKVSRTALSWSLGVGMGSFYQSSWGSADQSLLLDGQIEGANRGILEVIDILESDDRGLRVLKEIIRGRVALAKSAGILHVDEAVVAYSSEEGYERSVDGADGSGFPAGALVVRVPHSLRVSDELKIYDKLLPTIGQAHSGPPQRQVRVGPLALRLAATVAVLSRLEDTGRAGGLPGITRLDKLRLYDGRVAPPYNREHVRELHDQSPREGTFGLSPVFVANQLADAMSKETGCLTPPKALKCLLDGQAGVDDVEWDRVLATAKEAIAEYKELAIREVRRAGTNNYEENAGSLFDDYIESAELSQDAQGTEPDAKLLSTVEGALNLRDVERADFRQAVCKAVRYLRATPDSAKPNFSSAPALELAIENLLLLSRDELRLTLDPKVKSVESGYRLIQISQSLMEKQGYCSECAKDLIDFVRYTLQGKETLKIKRRQLVWES